MKKIFVNKIGLDHALEWKNCQDFGFVDETVKCIVDGCSEGLHSEVGAKLFCEKFKKNYDVRFTFEELTPLFPTFETIKNHLLFTIMYVTETEEDFNVFFAGDGIIIKEKKDGTFEYECIEQNNSPSYFAYNYIPNAYLKMYQDGVELQRRSFSKMEYSNIGVATDGLHYLLNSNYQVEFENLLRERKGNRIKLLLNKIHSEAMISILTNKTYPSPTFLKDDITIAF